MVKMKNYEQRLNTILELGEQISNLEKEGDELTLPYPECKKLVNLQSDLRYEAPEMLLIIKEQQKRLTGGAEKAVAMGIETAVEPIDACSVKGCNPSPSDQLDIITEAIREASHEIEGMVFVDACKFLASAVVKSLYIRN